MHGINGCCVAGMGSWVDDVTALMRTAGSVYQQSTNRPIIQMPTWGSGEPTWGSTTPTYYPAPVQAQTNYMPLLLLGGLAFLLMKR